MELKFIFEESYQMYLLRDPRVGVESEENDDM